MSTRHQEVLRCCRLRYRLHFNQRLCCGGRSAHNLILIVPEALPAVGIDQSNAPALARLRREGVSFANTYAGFPRLTAAARPVDSSDIGA